MVRAGEIVCVLYGKGYENALSIHATREGAKESAKFNRESLRMPGDMEPSDPLVWEDVDSEAWTEDGYYFIEERIIQK